MPFEAEILDLEFVTSKDASLQKGNNETPILKVKEVVQNSVKPGIEVIKENSKTLLIISFLSGSLLTILLLFQDGLTDPTDLFAIILFGPIVLGAFALWILFPVSFLTAPLYIWIKNALKYQREILISDKRICVDKKNILRTKQAEYALQEIEYINLTREDGIYWLADVNIKDSKEDLSFHLTSIEKLEQSLEQLKDKVKITIERK
ncbi:MAG: hypothetical protein AAF502_17470 [Bacteroidota bacterium]